MNADQMKRICVIGCGGAGKSTFSKKLALKTGLPLIHLDTLYWLPNWTEPDKDHFDRKLSAEMKAEKWILDGNFHRTMHARFKHTDTIFWLDYSTWRCVAGALKRLITEYGGKREDTPEGCVENFDWDFLKYVFNFRKNSRPKVLKQIENHAQHCKVIIFKSPKETENWINKNLC